MVVLGCMAKNKATIVGYMANLTHHVRIMEKSSIVSTSIGKITPLLEHSSILTRQDREVVNCTRSRVKNNSKLTNLMKISRIEGYNGK